MIANKGESVKRKKRTDKGSCRKFWQDFWKLNNTPIIIMHKQSGFCYLNLKTQSERMGIGGHGQPQYEFFSALALISLVCHWVYMLQM